MKKYKLLKDLPFAKADEELYIKRQEDGGYFTLYKDINKMSAGDLHEDYIENFNEWFEEIVEDFYFIDEKGFVSAIPKNYRHADIHLRQAISNYFEAKEEAERYLEYLKAKEIIKQDTNGFKADWSDRESRKYYGYWGFERGFKNYYEGGKPTWVSTKTAKEPNFYFKSWEDIEESFKKHPKEWKIYLTYEH